MEFAVRELQEYPASKVCKVLEIKLSVYYYRKKHPRINKLPIEMNSVIAMFNKHFGNFGRRTIRKLLLEEGVKVSEHKIAKILKAHGLRSKYGRKKGKNVYTAPEVSEKYISENLFPTLTEKERTYDILSIDFTEQTVSGKKVYTCGAININSKALVAEFCGCKNNGAAACATVEKAIEEHGVPYMIMTDRGSPFVSKSFHDLLEKYGIRHSMSRPHTPSDNCFIETFWKSMKIEIGKVAHLSVEQYMFVMEYYKHYYNFERPHSSLSYSAPLKMMI